MANYDPRSWREQYEELLCFVADLSDELEGEDGMQRFWELEERYDLKERHNVDYYARGHHLPGDGINFRAYREREGEPIPAATKQVIA